MTDQEFESELMDMIRDTIPTRVYIYTFVTLKTSEALGDALLRIIDSPDYEIPDPRIEVICVTPTRSLYMATRHIHYEFNLHATLFMEPLGLFNPTQTSNKFGGLLSNIPQLDQWRQVGYVDCTKVDVRPIMKGFNSIIGERHSGDYILDASVSYPYKEYNTGCATTIVNLEDFRAQISELIIYLNYEPEIEAWKSITKLTVEHMVDAYDFNYTFIITCDNPIREPHRLGHSRYRARWDPSLKVVSRTNEDALKESGPYHEHPIRKIGDWAVFRYWLARAPLDSNPDIDSDESISATSESYNTSDLD